MTKLTREDVIKLARLARIELSEKEIKEFQEQLSDMIFYVEQLQAVDISGLKPTNQVTGLSNSYREDIVKDYGYEAHELLKNVPHTLDNHIKVKRMIE